MTSQNHFKFFIGIIAVVAASWLLVSSLQSCKKDVPPSLIITVVDTNQSIVAGADVRVWYGADATGGVQNSDNYDQIGITDEEGKVTFSFPYSAILDINAFKSRVTPNPPFADVVDTLWGSTAVKVNTKRQRKKDNITEETVEVY